MYRHRSDPLAGDAYETGSYGLTSSDLAVAWLIGAPTRLRRRSSLRVRASLKARWVSGRLRARVLAAAIPGLSVDRATSIGRGCTIRCAPGGSIELRGADLALGVILEASEEASLYIGDARIGYRSLISARDTVRICDGVSVGDHVTIRDHNHVHSPDSGVSRTEWVSQPVSIGDRAWLGSKATILKGVTVGDRALVAAGAVVHDDVPDGAVVGGVPARKIR